MTNRRWEIILPYVQYFKYKFYNYVDVFMILASDSIFFSNFH